MKCLPLGLLPRSTFRVSSVVAMATLAGALACSSTSNPSPTGGAPGTGGAASGGSSTGGAATGGASTGGTHTGGSATGGASTGGAATGGARTGGNAGGSNATGGTGQAGQAGGKGGTATGGSAGGSGPSTGGTSGGGSSGGCSDASLLFCEDFESQTSDTPTSTKWTNEVSTTTGAAGTLTIDNMHSRGSKALHIHTTGNGRGLIHVKNFAPPSNSFYGRVWMYVDAFPSAPDYAHFTMVEAVGAGNASKVRFIGGQYISSSNGVFWGPGTDGGPTGDWTNWKTSAPAKGGAWVCLQWQADGSKSGISVSVDGQAKPDLTVSKTDHPNGGGDFVFPTFNDIWFGWWLYQNGPTPDHFDIWLDDLALGTTPIPCGK